MHVRLTHFTIQPEKVAEIIKIYYEEIAPVIQQQPGIVKVFLLEPLEGADQFISFTMWNSENDTKVFESSSAYPEVFGKIKEATSKPPHQEYYQVAGQL